MDDLKTIGQLEHVDLPKLEIYGVPARIDTGAQTSAIWASGIIEEKGVLQFVLFGPDSPLYTGRVLRFKSYELRKVSSSIGDSEERYVVKLMVNLHGRVIKASFTLANRSHQVYPMLIGRNILRGKFLVDVRRRPKSAERGRTRQPKHIKSKRIEI